MTSVDPPTMNGVEIAVGVVVSAFIIVTVVFSTVVLAVVFFRRKKRIYCLQSQSDDSIIDPDLQHSSTSEGRTRPSELPIQRINGSNPVTYQSTPQASSQRPLLHQDQNGPQSSISLPPPPPYSLTVNYTNGHTPIPPSHTHPQVVRNDSGPYPHYVDPNQMLDGGSQRDSLLELSDIDDSPGVSI